MLTEKFSTSDSDLESLISIPITEKSNNLKYQCSFKDCNKRFKRETHLDRHEFQHSGIRKHSCLYDNCDKSYIISTHLKRHIQTYHEKFRKPKVFKCQVPNCNKTFDSLFNVERHMSNTHSSPKVYMCKICNKDFPRKLSLRRHEIVLHNAEYPYKCETCQKGFIQEIHIKKHKCLQKSPQYKCETCNQNFAKWSLLIEHSKAEHNKAFECKCCGREFQRKVDLENHEKSVKRKQAVQGTKIQCPYDGCTRTYDFNKNLKHHIKIKHLANKFKCPRDGCDKELASKQKLNQHIKKIHETTTKKSTKLNTKSSKSQKRTKTVRTSYAAKLSGVIISKKVEDEIISEISNNSEKVEEKIDNVSFSETENDDAIRGNVITLELEQY